jgi:CheY-like chemotaxis protein
MSQSFQVLIVEDDKTFGPLLVKAFKKEGIEAQLSQTPEAAQTLCNHCDFPLILCDLMLPRMDGVTLIQNLLPQLSRKPEVFLMTGVFKDRGFLADAQKKTGAVEIFSKPFELDELMAKAKVILNRFAKEDPSLPSGLSHLFCQSPPPSKDLGAFCRTTESLPGLHLPFLIALLLEDKWEGAIHVQMAQNAGVIYIAEGMITQAFLDDSKSLLGHLLMDLGFVEPDDLEAALSSQDGALIGQKLIHQLSISPHALDLALSEQTALRLSKLVVPEILQLKFSPKAKVPSKNAHAISEKRLHQLYREWGASKYQRADLEELFSSSLSLPIRLFTPHLTKGPTEQIPFLKLCQTQDLENLVESLLKREVLPSLPVSNVDENLENLRNKYIKLEETMKTKNHFEVLGISTKAISREIEKAYLSLKASMNSNMHSAKDPELIEVCERIEARVERAYKTLIDDIRRGQYINQIEAEMQQQMMAKEPEYLLAVALLDEGKFRDARDIFQRLAQQKFNFPDLTTYLIIARARAEKKAIVEAELAKISPENRQSGIYMMAKAFAHKGAKNYPMAVQYFRKALVYNRNSKLAQQEIAVCLQRQSTIRRDQGSLLGGFVDGLLGGGKKSKKVS